MARTLGIVMDAIEHINVKKDSSFAMLLAAQERGWELRYMRQTDLFTSNDRALGSMRQLRVYDRQHDWYKYGDEIEADLGDLDVILMRKDPPFDMEYINTTYILELAERSGCLVVNHPSSLRDHNEKMSISRFPSITTPVCVSRNRDKLRRFVEQHTDVILKPLDGMGGASIFRVTPDDANLSVILETITMNDSRTVMAQRYIPEIKAGDKRILIIDGEPVPYALARIPAEGETRGNLAAGAHAEGVALTENDHRICREIAPMLRRDGILFAGIDVIGEYLTEINITSPTCIRELDALYDLDIAGQLMTAIEDRLESREP